MNQKIIDQNLDLMLNTNNHGMKGIILTESIGGNAGNISGMSCVAANFAYDAKTGRIEEFTNYAKGTHGYFRLAIDLQKTGKLRIIDIGVDKDSNSETILNIVSAAGKFNSRYAFNKSRLEIQ